MLKIINMKVNSVNAGFFLKVCEFYNGCHQASETNQLVNIEYIE